MVPSAAELFTHCMRGVGGWRQVLLGAAGGSPDTPRLADIGEAADTADPSGDSSAGGGGSGSGSGAATEAVGEEGTVVVPQCARPVGSLQLDGRDPAMVASMQAALHAVPAEAAVAGNTQCHRWQLMRVRLMLAVSLSRVPKRALRRRAGER